MVSSTLENDNNATPDVHDVRARPPDYSDRSSVVSMRWLRAAMIDMFGENMSNALLEHDFDSDDILSPKLLSSVAKKWLILSSSLLGSKLFTQPGSHTLRLSMAVTKIVINAVGGGGGGGSGTKGGGGSSGMGVSSLVLEVDPGTTITMTVGAGGAVDKDGGNTVIKYLHHGQTKELTLKGGRSGNKDGTAGARVGDGSTAGSAGYSNQVQTGQDGWDVTQGALYRTITVQQLQPGYAHDPNNLNLVQQWELQSITRLYPEVRSYLYVSEAFGSASQRRSSPVDYIIQAHPGAYLAARFNNSAQVAWIYHAVNTPVNPTYRTDNYKGSGGASMVSGYGRGGDGGSSGQNGYIKIQW